MQKNNVFNPFLPIDEYIPDGEPHVFDGRVYLLGSHDREGGYTFCMEDYVAYSAPVDDLSDWRKEGVIYRAVQDPSYPNPKYMFAPDVVRGNDGRFYLYYCMGGDYGVGGYTGTVNVAVCDEPGGEYEYLGAVRNPDGTPLKKYICFDPAVINDDGVIRLYYGTQYGDEEKLGLTDEVIEKEMDMFGRSREEILSYPDSINGPVMAVLSDDMLTVKEEPKHIIPYKVAGTGFEGHPFFEGSSIRKVGKKYYFIYSSWQNHELCYAVSDYPDRGFVFGGTIVSNGDIGLDGRTEKDKLNMTGTTHGSICEIAGQWYVFYHRLTHKSDYSRQACAEKINILPDGSIPQVEITSCGLNDGPLPAKGRFPSVICCNLTNGNMPHGSNSVFSHSFPNVTNFSDERFVGEIGDGTFIGYKYFGFSGVKRIGVSVRNEEDDNRFRFEGPIRIDERSEKYERLLSEKEKSGGSFGNDECFFEVLLSHDGEAVGRIAIDCGNDNDHLKWEDFFLDISTEDGTYPLYLVYHGKRKIQLREIIFE